MSDDRFDLDGRVAIVTGASSGFGAHLSRTLAAAGAQVVAAARRADRLDELATDVAGVVPVACDVTDDVQCEALVDRALGELGRVDILVNNAGASDAQPAIDEPIDDFRSVVELNLNASFWLARLVAGPMREQGSGSIINIASVHGLVAAAPNHQAAYTASKGGLVTLTRELAVQWAGYGIRVNAVAPGYFATELTDDMLASDSGTRWIERNTPLRRPGELYELDGPVLLLASDAGSYITGAVLTVDGGWTAR
ncbi:MAG: glucose 1-dehydrogenase [Acidimicrobiia bacterium]|nr:glucose 1-dehydrogenase [Acidimicrobiia bacterium]